MTHTTKKDLTMQLRPLSKATLKLLAVEVGCVVHRAGAATHDASAPQLADFLMRFPLSARRAVALLRTTSKDATRHALADCIEGIRGCGPMTVGRWLLTPDASGVQCVSETKRCYVCHSTDLRVGVIVLDTPDASAAVPLAFAGLPKGVSEALILLLGPPPEVSPPKRKTR